MPIPLLQGRPVVIKTGRCEVYGGAHCHVVLKLQMLRPGIPARFKFLKKFIDVSEVDVPFSDFDLTCTAQPFSLAQYADLVETTSSGVCRLMPLIRRMLSRLIDMQIQLAVSSVQAQAWRRV